MQPRIALKIVIDKLYALLDSIKSKFQRNPLANDADPFTFIAVDMSGGGMSTYMLRIDSEKII
jgi:hypothetical protein